MHREECEVWLAGTNVRESTELHNEFKRSVLEKTQMDMGKCCLTMSVELKSMNQIPINDHNGKSLVYIFFHKINK